MVIASLFQLWDWKLQFAYIDFTWFVFCSRKLHMSSARYDRYLSIIKIYKIICVFNHWCCIGWYEILIVTNAYDKRTALANGYQLVWVITVYNDYGICSDNLFDRLLDRFKKSAVVRYPDILYQIDKYFTIRCSTKGISLCNKNIFLISKYLYNNWLRVKR